MNEEETRKHFRSYMKNMHSDQWERMFTPEAHDAYFDCWLSGFYTGVRVARNTNSQDGENNDAATDAKS